MIIVAKGKCKKCGVDVSEKILNKTAKWYLDRGIKEIMTSSKCWYCNRYVELWALLK